jgi:hypothetical protein
MAKRDAQSGQQNSTRQRASETEAEERPSLAQRTERSDSADAFFPDPQGGGISRAPDDLAETLAEDFVASATTGNDVDDEVLNQVVPEEIGGPFIETTPAEEFAEGYDESNPEDATVEPRPLAVSGVVERPPE